MLRILSTTHIDQSQSKLLDCDHPTSLVQAYVRQSSACTALQSRIRCLSVQLLVCTGEATQVAESEAFRHVRDAQGRCSALPQSEIRQLHPAEAEISHRAHPQMCGAALAQKPIREVERCRDQWHTEFALRLVSYQSLESGHYIRSAMRGDRGRFRAQALHEKMD
jgi:hypothetical protein